MHRVNIYKSLWIQFRQDQRIYDIMKGLCNDLQVQHFRKIQTSENQYKNLPTLKEQTNNV